MSTCRQLWQATSLVAGLLLAVPAIWQEAAGAEEAAGRLATFEKAPGESYFALSILPKVAADPAQTNDVVVMFDTSASQAGVFRDDALAALNSLLKGLGANDRVHLMAVDVKAAPLSEGFTTASGPEIEAAIAKLRQRVPLGATDLDAGLRAAAMSLKDAKGAKTVVYLGDGMSKANLPNNESFAALVGDLVKDRVTVSSFAIGKEANLQVLGALANQTGGVVTVDDQPAEAAVNAGAVLAGSIHGSVIWPTETALPASITETLPKNTPPLRTDRDSVLIGKLSGAEGGDVKVSGEMNGKAVELVAAVTPEKSNEDFAFLPRLVEVAQADGGLSLPTVGSAGLRQAAAVTMTSAEQLAKLGRDALATGNVAGAVQAAEAALARDPKNPEALAVREAARKFASGGQAPVARAAEPELRLAAADQPADAAPAAPAAGADGSLLAEVLAGQSDAALADDGLKQLRAMIKDNPDVGPALRDRLLNQIDQALGQPGFLGKADVEQQVRAGMMQAEVENALSSANRLMGTNPEQAEQDLKLLMETVEKSTDLEPALRAQLREQIENSIRQARQQVVVVSERRAAAEQTAAQAAELQRLSDDLAVRESRLVQIMARFDALMAERRYTIADTEVIPEIERLAPETVLANSVATGGRMKKAYYELRDIWQRREAGFLGSLYQVEASFIPFIDEPPIVYPDLEWFEKISIDRIAKYGSMDLLKPGSSEQLIFNELKEKTKVEFLETPLKDAIEFLEAQHGIPIEINAKKLEEAGVSIDTPVTRTLDGVTLRSALRLILGELELTYMVKDEVLQITTPEDAESPENMMTKVYNVGDLVVPIVNQSGLGAGGIGGGFGMMGGMGGMGGGMGGMGGGMMGGGMGGMGGMFDVEDDLSLGTKKAAAKAAAPKPQAKADEPARRPAAKSAKKIERLTVTVAEGQTSAEAWDALFAAEKSRLSSQADPTAAARDLLASLRETIRQLMHEKKYAEVTDVIQAALRHGHVEPWMYEAMGLAMQADHAAPEDLERALMSAVDFARSNDEVMFIASYMASIGLTDRALSLCRQLGNADPTRPEPFLQGLALAKRTGDLTTIQWAVVGILGQAWTGDDVKIAEDAYRLAKATYEKLLAEGKKTEAEALDAGVRKAMRRDCVVVVTWTGDADVDIAVEEPAGTICSAHQPRTTSGGVHLGDVAATANNQSTKAFKEMYVCPQAFDGQYRLLVKNVWGKTTSRKVNVEVYTNYGSEKQLLTSSQVPLGEKNAAVLFEIKDGRRQDPLPEAQVANVVNVQNAMNRQILGQQLAAMDDSEAARNLAAMLASANDNDLFPFLRRGAVGYRPVIQNFPEGAGFQSTAVISADRRYVRVSPVPFFSQINEVSTFNFVTGEGTTQQQGQGGGGGIGFGGGGGGGIF